MDVVEGELNGQKAVGENEHASVTMVSNKAGTD